MNNYEINLTFKNSKECEKWVEENCPGRRYKDKAIFMIEREAHTFDEQVTITRITTL